MYIYTRDLFASKYGETKISTRMANSVFLIRVQEITFKNLEKHENSRERTIKVFDEILSYY